MEIKSEKSNTTDPHQAEQMTDEDWTLLYQRNFDPIRKFVLINKGNVQQAEDIYHEAFMVAWRNVQLGKYEFRSEQSMNAYILAIGKNKWIDMLRSASRNKTLHLVKEVESEGAEDAEAFNEERDIGIVKKQFKKLGENCQQLLIAFYFKKKSMREIAEMRGWTASTSKNNKYRCLQKLRELINQNIP